MSTPESHDAQLLQYRLGERLGNSTWKAEDTRTGKQVVVKILPRGQAKLGGFNLATFLQKREGMPSAFQQRGGDERAVAYMAPEQITNQPTTVHTDIFSLGLVLYEMATGRPAYQATSAAEIARKIVSEQPPNPKSINSNIDNAMLNVLGK